MLAHSTPATLVPTVLRRPGLPLASAVPLHLACFSPLSIHGWLPHLLQALSTFQLCSKTFPDYPIHNSNFPSSIPFCVLFHCFCIALSNIYTYFFLSPPVTRTVFSSCQMAIYCLSNNAWQHAIMNGTELSCMASTSKYLVLQPLVQEPTGRKGARNDF